MADPYQVVDVPGVGEVEFPDSMSDADIQSAILKLTRRPDNTGIKLAAAGASVPLAARAAAEVATNPNVSKAGSILGQILGGIEGVKTGGPLGAAGGVWTGGKAGWFTGKLMQRLASPVATVLDKVTPYAQTLSTLGGAQGVNDLAQMAEPNRRDIGFLGMGAPPTNIPPAPAMTPEQQAAYDQTWQGKLGRLLGRAR